MTPDSEAGSQTSAKRIHALGGYLEDLSDIHGIALGALLLLLLLLLLPHMNLTHLSPRQLQKATNTTSLVS